MNKAFLSQNVVQKFVEVLPMSLDKVLPMSVLTEGVGPYGSHVVAGTYGGDKNSASRGPHPSLRATFPVRGEGFEADKKKNGCDERSRFCCYSVLSSDSAGWASGFASGSAAGVSVTGGSAEG